MRTVDTSLFSNVVIAAQRTSRLPGGAVRGLPGGLVIDGIQGATSFAGDIAEAQKEFERGRVHTALDRVRQVETQFNGLSGRWSSTIQNAVSTARQGRQSMPLQKLNEIKAAQSKMQPLIGTAVKAFRDLTSSLETEIARSAPPKGGPDAWFDSLSDRFALKTQIRVRKNQQGKPAITPPLAVGNTYAARESDAAVLFEIVSLEGQAAKVQMDGQSDRREVTGPQWKQWLIDGLWMVSRIDR